MKKQAPEPKPFLAVGIWGRLRVAGRGEQLVTIQESQLSSNGLGPLPPGIADALIRYPETLVNFDELMRRISGRYELRIALDSGSAAAVFEGQQLPGIALIFTRREI